MYRVIISALITFTLIGCEHTSLPKKADIVAEFKKDHPTATVLDAVVGEGDSQHAYWKITFTNPGSNEVQTVDWGVRSVHGNSWEIFHK